MIPSRNQNTVTGVALMQIISFNIFPKYTKINAEASTLIENCKKIEINLFHDNKWGVGAKDLLELLNETEFNSNILNKLIYVELKVNKKGFQEISTLFFTIEQNELLHDPRISKIIPYNVSLNNIFDDSLDIFDI